VRGGLTLPLVPSLRPKSPNPLCAPPCCSAHFWQDLVCALHRILDQSRRILGESVSGDGEAANCEEQAAEGATQRKIKIPCSSPNPLLILAQQLGVCQPRDRELGVCQPRDRELRGHVRHT
jgi:hypothetical protein